MYITHHIPLTVIVSIYSPSCSAPVLHTTYAAPTDASHSVLSISRWPCVRAGDIGRMHSRVRGGDFYRGTGGMCTYISRHDTAHQHISWYCDMSMVPEMTPRGINISTIMISSHKHTYMRMSHRPYFRLLECHEAFQKFRTSYMCGWILIQPTTCDKIRHAHDMICT